MSDRRFPNEEDARYAAFLQEQLIEIVRQGNISPEDFTDLYQTTTDPEILRANIRTMQEQQHTPIVDAALAYDRNNSR